MAEDWFSDVQRYAATADENVVRKIVNYLGIALRNRDSSLVSFSDVKEVGRVRENYLRKKLGLTGSDDVLDSGIDWVKGLMAGDRTRNRVTVYYLLAHYFGKLDLFGGPAGTSGASLDSGLPGSGAAAVAGSIATGAAAGSTAETSTARATASVTPLRSQSVEPSRSPSRPEEMAADSAASAPRSPAGGSTLGRQETSARPLRAANPGEGDEPTSGWPRWLTWLLIALAIVALFFILRSCMADRSSTSTDVASNPATAGSETNSDATTDALAADSAGGANTIPAGAGVVSGERDNKPMLSVYFDTGKSAVTADMATASGTLKAYLDAHPGSTLAVSGYNDPSGNAALNAELSKSRAQAVAAALTAAGIPSGSVELVKPADTTATTVTPEEARRVEVTVRQ